MMGEFTNLWLENALGQGNRCFQGVKNSLSLMIYKQLNVQKDNFGAFQGIVMYSSLTGSSSNNGLHKQFYFY